MSVRPFRWDLVPRLTRAEVTARRALAAHLGRFSRRFELDRLIGGALELDVGALAVWPTAELGARLGDAHVVRAQVDDVPVLVAVDRSAAIDLVGRVLGYPDEVRAPRPLAGSEDAILSFMVAHVARCAGLALDLAASVASEDPWSLVLSLRATWPGGGGQVRLVAAERVLQRLPSPAGLTLPDARARLGVTGGRVRLPASRVASLRLGDVVVFFDAHTRVSAGRLQARARRDGERLTLETAFVEEPMSTDLLDHAEVEITVQLGRAVVPVRELAALQPGSVLELDRPIAGPVDLHVGDRRIARGEIVDVEGRLGVRIRELG